MHMMDSFRGPLLRSVSRLEKTSVTAELGASIGVLAAVVQHPSSTLNECLYALAAVQQAGDGVSDKHPELAESLRSVRTRFWRLVKALPPNEVTELLQHLWDLGLLKGKNLEFARQAVSESAHSAEVDCLLFLLHARCATEHNSRRFDQAIVARLIDLVEQFTPEQVRWALSLCGHVPPGVELLRAIRQLTSDRAGEFSLEELERVYPVVRPHLLPHQSERFRGDLEERVRRATGDVLPRLREIQTKLFPGDERLIAAIDTVRFAEFRSFQAADAARLLRSITVTREARGLRRTSYVHDVECRALELLPSIQAEYLADVIGLLSALGSTCEQTLSAIVEALNRVYREVPLEDLLRIAWDLAEVRAEGNISLLRIYGRVQQSTKPLPIDALCRFAIVLALNCPHFVAPLVDRLARTRLDSLLRSNYSVGMVDIACSIAKVPLPNGVRDKAQTIHRRLRGEPRKPRSKSEARAASVLREAGFDVTPQEPIGVMVVDMLVERNGRKVVVEFDGQLYHYLNRSKLGDRRTGWEIIRDRYTESKGFPTVRIAQADYKAPNGKHEMIASVLEEMNALG